MAMFAARKASQPYRDMRVWVARRKAPSSPRREPAHSRQVIMLVRHFGFLPVTCVSAPRWLNVTTWKQCRPVFKSDALMRVTG